MLSIRSLVFFIFILCLHQGLTAQTEKNPFELPSKEQEADLNQEKENQNPFEIQKSVDPNVKPLEDAVLPGEAFGPPLGIAIGLLVLLAILLTFFRGVFNDFWESTYRDRRFNQFFRRMKSMWILPNILFYLYFCISVGIFSYACIAYFNDQVSGFALVHLGTIIGSLLAFFFLKHLILEFIGSTFEVSNETSRYSMLIMTFNIILGIVITPFVVLLLLGPVNIHGATIVIGLLIAALFLGLFLLRSLSLSNQLLVQHTFHFFMYLCAIEIAPLFIIAKVIG